MQHKLLKMTLLALLTWAVVPSLNAQMAHIGDILCEGDLIVSPANYNANTHTAIGVVFYVDQTGQHGWAIALEDAGSYTWGRCGDTPLTNYHSRRQALYDLNGYENTQVVRACGTDYPAFYAVDFENGWYLPTLGQFNYLYGNIMEVNSSLTMVGGVSFEMGGSWEYWTSTEYDNNNTYYSSYNGYQAWWFNSSGGMEHGTYSGYASQDQYLKCHRNCRVRAARNF